MAGRIAYYGNIVTNGLVLDLDAGKRDSYPGSGTTWRDISGRGNNGTLTNGPTFNSANAGSIVFDGVDDYVNTTFTQQLNDFSVCSWFKASAVLSYSRIVDKNFNTGFWMGKNATDVNKWGGGVRQSSNYNMITLDDTSWHFLVMVRTGTSLIVYGDGANNNNTTVCGSGAIDSTALSLGGTINDGGGLRDWFRGNISSLQIYNRALSAAEVQQNYNALKSRYGL